MDERQTGALAGGNISRYLCIGRIDNMKPQPPWTDVGHLQSELGDLKQKILGKADLHEIRSLFTLLHTLEHSVREISSALDELRRRCGVLEEKGEKP